MARKTTNTGESCIYKEGNNYRVKMSMGARRDVYSISGNVTYPRETIGIYKTLEEAIIAREEAKAMKKLGCEKMKQWRRMRQGLSPTVKKREQKSCEYKGVTYRPRQGSYVACMTRNKKWIYLGAYKTAEEARDVYLAACAELESKSE